MSRNPPITVRTPWAVLVCALFACLALAWGCSKQEPAPTEAPADPAQVAAPAPVAEAPEPAKPAEPQKVVLWHSYRDAERKALDGLVAHWNRNHPEIQVDALAVPYDAIIDKVQITVPRGNGPDLVIMAHDKVGTWAREKVIQPLGDFASSERLGRFLPQTVKPLVFEKAIYGLPLAFKSLVLFYNKAMVQTPPQTLGQLVEVGKGFTDEKAGKFGLAYDAGDLYQHAAWLHGAGGSVVDETGRPRLHSPEAVEALGIVRDLHVKHGILPKGMTGFVITALFNDGKAPFVFNGPWFIPEIDPSIQWGVAPLPEIAPGKPLKPYLGSEAVMLTHGTQVRDAALRIADYLTSDEAAVTRLQDGRQMVANRKIYENPKWSADPVVKVFRAQADNSVAMPNTAEAGVVWTPYNSVLRKVIFGDAKPDEALREADGLVAEAVSRLGR